MKSSQGFALLALTVIGVWLLIWEHVFVKLFKKYKDSDLFRAISEENLKKLSPYKEYFSWYLSSTKN